jgi:hypothetical protein
MESAVADDGPDEVGAALVGAAGVRAHRELEFAPFFP